MTTRRSPSGSGAGESNGAAYARYRGIMERDLAGSDLIMNGREPWERNMEIAAKWMARYSRRRDLIDALPGWGNKLADVTGRDALVARNLALDAAYTEVPVWDEMTHYVLGLSLQNGRQLRLDITSLSEPCRYGPSLRRLWAEAKARGLDDEAAWQHIAAWALHRPSAWDRDDERKRRRPLHETSPDSHWGRTVIWQKTDDLDHPWAAHIDSEYYWQVRLNDFPDDHLYTLLVNGGPVADFDDWPVAWDRGAPRLAETAPPGAARPAVRSSVAVAGARWLERYRAGEYEAVWAEMLSLGPDVRQRRYHAHAVAVARETMQRARHNVENIIRTLDGMGYNFGDGGSRRIRTIQDHLQDTDVYVRPEPEDSRLLDEWEREGMVLPLSLRIWMEEVGRVDLCGSHPALCFLERGPRFPGVYADPLNVVPTADSLEDFLGFASEDDHIFISFDAWGKSAIGGPDQIDTDYSMEAPNLAVDGVLKGERHGITFVEYLRLSFKWGGFPGWEGQSQVPERELARLREGLLPI